MAGTGKYSDIEDETIYGCIDDKLKNMLDGVIKEERSMFFDEVFIGCFRSSNGSINILLKPGTLNDEEFEVIKTHAQTGHSILKNSKRPILKAVAIISYEYHEKHDGSGCPRGLKESDLGYIKSVIEDFSDHSGEA